MSLTLTLHAQCELLKLTPGDMVVDIGYSTIGILINRIRRTTIQDDDIYFWIVHWDKSNQTELPYSTTDGMSAVSAIVEESGLKISIIIGLYELFSVNDSGD
jgi:hypothetical protein